MTGDTLPDFINNDLFPIFKRLSTIRGGPTPRGLVVKAAYEDAFNYTALGQV